MAQDTTNPTDEVEEGRPSDDHLDQIAQKYSSLFDEGSDDTPPGETATAAPDARTETKAEVEDQPQATAEATAPVEGKSAQILALARREAALRAKEKEYETSFETKVQAAVQAEIEKLRQAATRNPAEFYKALGVEDIRPVANDLYYNIMGDEAPAEFKARQTEHSIRSEIEQVRAQLKAAEERAQAERGQAELKTYVSKLEGYVSGAAPEKLPYLKAEFDADPQATLDAMVTAASNLSQSGTVPTAEQVAEALNAELAKIADRYVKAATVSSKNAPVGQPSQTRTLSNVSPKSKGSSDDFNLEEAYRRAERIAKESFRRD